MNGYHTCKGELAVGTAESRPFFVRAFSIPWEYKPQCDTVSTLGEGK